MGPAAAPPLMFMRIGALGVETTRIAAYPREQAVWVINCAGVHVYGVYPNKFGNSTQNVPYYSTRSPRSPRLLDHRKHSKQLALHIFCKALVMEVTLNEPGRDPCIE